MALDFKRAAIGYHSGSVKMADIFIIEVIKRSSQLDTSNLQPSIQRLLQKISLLPKEKDVSKKAEDSLLYSTIFLSFAK